MHIVVNNTACAVVTGWHKDANHSGIKISTDLVGLDLINFLLDLRLASLNLLNKIGEDARRSLDAEVGVQRSVEAHPCTA